MEHDAESALHLLCREIALLRIIPLAQLCILYIYCIYRDNHSCKTTDTKGARVEIIVSNSSDKPIYAQIASHIKTAILSGELEAGQALPSIRALANDLQVSVITTKRAYSDLEALGFIETRQGKGSFVASGNLDLMREDQLRQVEALLQQAIDGAHAASISIEELHDMLDTLAES